MKRLLISTHEEPFKAITWATSERNEGTALRDQGLRGSDPTSSSGQGQLWRLRPTAAAAPDSQPGISAQVHQQQFDFKGRAVTPGPAEGEEGQCLRGKLRQISLKTSALSARRDLAKTCNQTHLHDNSQRTSHSKTKSSWLGATDWRPLKLRE